jgi:thioredoxin 1
MPASYISAEEFKSNVQNGEGAYLVDFTASWCGPCKSIAPMLDDAANEYAGRVDVVKIDIDQARPLAAELGIRGVPTLILFKGGKELNKHVGALNKAQFDALVSPAL